MPTWSFFKNQLPYLLFVIATPPCPFLSPCKITLALFKILMVGDTPQEISFLTVLQHLLKIDPGNEELSDTVWQAVEQLVSKATVLECSEDAHRLLTSISRRLDGSNVSGPGPGRSRRDSQADLSQETVTENSSQGELNRTLTSTTSGEANDKNSSNNGGGGSETSMTVLSPPQPPPPPPPLPTPGNSSTPAAASSTMLPGPPPPPPPPPPGGAPPPPPPPPGGAVSSSSGDLPQTNIPKPRGKMKTLQWQKIPITSVIGKANLWTMVGRMSQQYEMDYEKMDELFSVNLDSGPKRPGQAGDVQLDSKKKKENMEINILDGKRSLNVNIFLKQFRMEHEQIVQILRDGRSDLFGPERLRGFLKLLPSQEEIDALKAFEGDRDRLGNAEKFFLTLMNLPNYRMRIEGLLIREEFNTTIEWIRPSIEAVLQAAKDIQENTSLRELIFLILISGNYLNSGNYAGNAAGFKLSSLLKLTELRANKPKMNLMHYVAQEAEEKNPRLLDFPNEMKFLKDASSVSVEGLNTDIGNITSKVRALTEQIVVAGRDFQQQMAEFLQAANVEVNDLEEDLKDIETMRKELATFFCEDSNTFKLEECFRVLQSFCDRMRKAIEENAQRKKQEAKADERRKQMEAEARKNL
ncbi:Fh2 domain-containing protein 1, partial [Plakobranchus ocellatus]